MMQSILLAKPSSSVNAESAQGSVKDNQLKNSLNSFVKAFNERNE